MEITGLGLFSSFLILILSVLVTWYVTSVQCRNLLAAQAAQVQTANQ